jgi:hypothetical protein
VDDPVERAQVRYYALVEPDSDQVRYVGQTQDSLNWRLDQHLFAARVGRSGSAKSAWIKNLALRGRERRIVLLQKTTVRRDAIVTREMQWMRFFHDAGHQLLNHPIPGPRF